MPAVAAVAAVARTLVDASIPPVALAAVAAAVKPPADASTPLAVAAAAIVAVAVVAGEDSTPVAGACNHLEFAAVAFAVHRD